MPATSPTPIDEEALYECLPASAQRSAKDMLTYLIRRELFPTKSAKAILVKARYAELNSPYREARAILSIEFDLDVLTIDKLLYDLARTVRAKKVRVTRQLV